MVDEMLEYERLTQKRIDVVYHYEPKELIRAYWLPFLSMLQKIQQCLRSEIESQKENLEKLEQKMP